MTHEKSVSVSAVLVSIEYGNSIPFDGPPISPPSKAEHPLLPSVLGKPPVGISRHKPGWLSGCGVFVRHYAERAVSKLSELQQGRRFSYLHPVKKDRR